MTAQAKTYRKRIKRENAAFLALDTSEQLALMRKERKRRKGGTKHATVNRSDAAGAAFRIGQNGFLRIPLDKAIARAERKLA